MIGNSWCRHMKKENAHRPTTLDVAVGVALLLGAPASRILGWGWDIQAIFVLAAVFWMSLFLMPLHERKIKARLAALDLPDGTYPVEVEVSLRVGGQPGQVDRAIRTAICALPNAKPATVFHGNSATAIKTRTRHTIFSPFGDVIIFSVKPSDEGSEVRLVSKPGFFTVTYDSRMNYQNVSLIMRQLKQCFAVGVLRANFDVARS